MGGCGLVVGVCRVAGVSVVLGLLLAKGVG